MREAMFIKKNVDKWNTYQTKAPDTPDEAAEQFTTLIDDLSYAKTFYPRSKVTHWINGLAAIMYQDIYQNKKEKYSRVFDFWKYELPFLFKKYQRILLFTTVTFCLFVTLGVLASRHNPQFVREVLGNEYVSMTEHNIENGDPFGVYKDDNKFSMFVRIAFNNIKVAFFTFVSGFTAGLFTLKLLWDNGLMLGCFEYMFFEHGLGLRSVLVIWIHGTLEIASIIIAGTAGFVLANGMLFPGSYPWLVSFRRSGKDAAKILVSLVPFFIVAAFLESYITHLMSRTFSNATAGGLPVWAGFIILGTSLYAIAWYFVLWPMILHKRGYKPVATDTVNRLVKTNA